MSVTINFYRERDAFGYFSNFSKHSVEIDGKSWPTSEHYFQAMKFADPALQERVRKAATPSIAAKLGRDRGNPLRSDWESVKEDVMRKAIRAKFTQHPNLKLLLLDTANAKLVEQTKNDSYWGDGGDGSGKNRLGFLLMELRDCLRQGK